MRLPIDRYLLPVVLIAAALPQQVPAANENDIAKTTAPVATAEPADYRIGVSDVLQIMVWREPEASVPAVVVRSDGKISVPLLKEVYVEGLTPTQLEKILTERLGKLVRDVDVTVLVKDVHSKKIYILGAVKHEGTISLQRPLTVIQAVAEAGGFTDYAKPRKIYVLRRENGRQARVPFDYMAAIRGGSKEPDLILLPDDTVVVPR